MSCCVAREGRTWKWLWRQMKRGRIFILFTDTYAWHDLIMPIRCKVFGHDPVILDEKDPDCNCIVCKRCGRFLPQ